MKGIEYRVEVARHVFAPTTRVGIVDDFLARGRTAAALVDIAEEAGCSVVGAAFAIGKATTGGRALLKERRVEAFAMKSSKVSTTASSRSSTKCECRQGRRPIATDPRPASVG